MFLLLPSLSFCLINIIPRPAFISEVPDSQWVLTEGMQIGYDSSTSSYAKKQAQRFSDFIYIPTGIRLPITESSDVKIGIQITTSPDDQYHINMDSNLIQISANTDELLFYAFQTILQLLPPQIFLNTTVTDKIIWSANCIHCEDKPRFQWRGIMLDVCRHFFDVSTVKSIIDQMSHYKLNVLHFHLTEDQGWRLELKNFPNLTRFGSRRDASPVKYNRFSLDGVPYGPFYFSEADITEIIEYGKERFVRIVPEIEMPGHALSFLSGYPQYSCTGGPFKPRCFWGVEDDIICAGNDEAISFLEGLLDDVLELFDSVFIHCGGDECPRVRWQACEKCQKRIKDEGLQNEDQLQSWFTRHFASYLEKKGRRLMGWDEILDGNLPFPESTVIMAYRGVETLQKATSLGHDVVMGPSTNLYLDYCQFPAYESYEYFGGIVTSYMVYSYEPTNGIDEDMHHHVLGVQGNMWSEYVWTLNDLQYKLFPRSLSVAEVGWSKPENKDWPRFLMNYAKHHKDVLQQLGVVDAGMQAGSLGVWRPGELSKDKWVSVEFPVDGCLNKKGTVGAAFVHKSGNECRVKNVKFLFNDALAGQDDHEGVVSENPQNSVYTFNTDRVPSGKTSIQAEMMCVDGDDCEGVIYVYLIKAA